MIVVTNQDNWSETRLYYIEKDDYPNNDGTYWVNASGADELNMADASTLVWFIQTVQRNFPSDRLLLSLWDHNWGWHTGWFQKDETSGGGTMSYADLRTALDASGVSGGVDLVAYDACVSSQIEVMHTWRPFAGIFVGSQDYIGWGGVNYADVIGVIQKTPDISPQNLSTVVAESILTDSADHCASAVALDGGAFDDLVKYTSKLASVFVAHLDVIRDRLIAIREAVPQTPHYPADDAHRDLYGVAAAAINSLADFPDIVEVAADIIGIFDAVVLYNQVTGESCASGMGISVYWTKSGDFVESEDYSALSFARATQWDEFLMNF